MTNGAERVESLMVSLYVYGDDLIPDMISNLLRVLPTRMQRKDESRNTKSGKAMRAKTGMWELRSKIRSMDLTEHVESIFSQFGRSDVCISQLDGVEFVHLDVYVASLPARLGYKSLDLELSLTDMVRLAGLGASVRISITDGGFNFEVQRDLG